MAEPAVSTAVTKLAQLAIENLCFLLSVDKRKDELEDELQYMQRFLKDAEQKQDVSESVRGWISDIRKVAFDTEDAIETFALKVDERRGSLERCAGFPKYVYHLCRLGQEFESIVKRIKAIDVRRERYGIQGLNEGARMASSAIVVGSRRVYRLGQETRKRHKAIRRKSAKKALSDSDLSLYRRAKMAPSDVVESSRRDRVYPWHTDKYVIGLEQHVDTLLGKGLLMEKQGLSFASIVGIDGVGKSTLAKKVYNHWAVVDKFGSHRAWVTVSRDFNYKKFLKKLVSELTKPAGTTAVENLSEESLEQRVQDCLQGTEYFVVLDDVWDQQHWESISRVFPDEKDKASRLLITSRTHNIPSRAQYVHELEGLDPAQSWKLFLKTAFIENNDDECPRELEGIGRKIAEKCKGLPLAITVMGALLLEQGQSVSKWERVLEGINSRLEAGKLDIVRAVLELSYWDLTPHLKSCFLYLSFFEEDEVIRTERLIAIWIAEGIVPQGNGKETMEEIAKSYLDELIKRNMVQAIEVSVGGQVESCQMHDLLRDMSIGKAKEEIKFDILSTENTFDQSLDVSRHLVIHCSNQSPNLSRSPNQQLRSLFLRANGGEYGCIPPPDIWKRIEGCNLKVLEFENVDLIEVFEGIGKLIGLKYLAFYGSHVEKLPRSLGHLTNLQTLYIPDMFGIEVPNVIWKLVYLRHLYMPRGIIWKEALKLDTLKNLQTLYCVQTNGIVVEHLGELISLCSLGLYIMSIDDVKKLLMALAKLENLLVVKLFCESNIALSLDGIVNLQHVIELHIIGNIVELPNNFPQNLSRLNLCDSNLKKMVIPHNGLFMLEVLTIFWLPHLEEMHIENGGLPMLKQLEIRGCDDLEILPENEEKRMLSNLQELKIFGCRKLAAKLKGDSYSHIISNIPCVEI